jgi:hypothetical protein
MAPRSPGWQAFLRNHTAHIAGIDLFDVPTVGFKLLYGPVILRLVTSRLQQYYPGNHYRDQIRAQILA